jgi:pimeloyl-ACP methyl ester carboxylesterase
MKPTKGYAAARWGQVHYADTRTGQPLVLVHQSPTDSVQFARALAPLSARGIRAIAIDIPGFGGSDVPDAPPVIADYAHIVPAVLDALGLRTAAVLGHHTGAVIVTEAALQYASRVDRVVLHGALPMSDEERGQWRQLLAREQEWNLRWDGSHIAELWQQRFQAQPQWTDLEAFHANFIHGLTAGRTVWYAHDAVMTYRHEEAIDRLTQPTLFLSNTGDAIHYVAERARARWSQHSYRELPGGTIDYIDEQPETWAAAVAEFVLAKA